MTALAMEVEPPPAPHVAKRPAKKCIRKKCKHGKSPYVCPECGGSSLCKHTKQKASCKDCGGSAFCEHGIRRSQCRECGGGSFCRHGTLRPDCRECGGGTRWCNHGKRRQACMHCQNLPCTIEGCPRFGHKFSSTQVLLNHMRSKHSGEPKALTKTKELDVYKALQVASIEFEYQKHIPFRS